MEWDGEPFGPAGIAGAFLGLGAIPADVALLKGELRFHARVARL
jgi:hypothetical protein